MKYNLKIYFHRYWGWGKEDDELYTRIMEAGMKIQRPKNISTGKSTFKHIHSKEKPRDTTKCFNQYKETKNFPDKETGMDSVSYKIGQINEMFVKDVPTLLLNVLLVCDYQKTPWCDCRALVRVGNSIHPIESKEILSLYPRQKMEKF